MDEILPLLVVSLLLLISPLSVSTGIRIDLTYVDSKLNLSKPELIQRAIQRTKHHVFSLTSSNDILVRVYHAPRDGGYQLEYTIGSPSVPLSAILDTGSDLIWTQCQRQRPCDKCYNPSKSITFTKISCTNALCQSLPADIRNCDPDCSYHNYSYLGGTSTRGELARETFTFGSVNPVEVSGIGFGCSDYTKGGEVAIFGLGRGELSLVSQLGLQKFSYCLTSFGEPMSSPLLLGSLAILNGSARSTPFIQNPSIPSLYYLSLQGITVGATRLPFPNTVFAPRSDGLGGFVIDSGTTFTLLEEEVYRVLKQEFQSQVKLPVVTGSVGLFDLCFSLPSTESNSMVVHVPRLVFHFYGADMEFPGSNYIVPDARRDTVCLAMMSSPGPISIMGNFQQQNMHIRYDLAGGKLTFMPAQCDHL